MCPKVQRRRSMRKLEEKMGIRKPTCYPISTFFKSVQFVKVCCSSTFPSFCVAADHVSINPAVQELEAKGNCWGGIGHPFIVMGVPPHHPFVDGVSTKTIQLLWSLACNGCARWLRVQATPQRDWGCSPWGPQKSRKSRSPEVHTTP